jgi:hypothetical protein
VSQWVVSRILHEQLLYPYHVQRVQGLSPADYPVRRHFCKWFLLDWFLHTVHLHITTGRLETF